MKKLLWRSSIALWSAFLMTSIIGCKAKKVKQAQATNTGIRNASREVRDAEIPDEVETGQNDKVIIHTPGTINQKGLDSTKRSQMKLKRMYTR